jgi:CheY-like chemotaxis protein
MTHILLIEDDPAVAEAIVFVLQGAGHEITHVPDAAKAAEALEKGHYDCALVDVWLGEDDGLAFLASQRERYFKLPFVVISGGGPGKTLEHVTARADALGAVGVLYKPFTDEELFEAVAAATGDKAMA